jgi:hypothetical protein
MTQLRNLPERQTLMRLITRRRCFAGAAELAAPFILPRRAFAVTAWVDEPYDATKFKPLYPQTSDPVQWIVLPANVSVYKYLMIGPDTMMLDFSIQETQVAGYPLDLAIKVPAGKYLTAKSSTGYAVWFENGYANSGPGRVYTSADEVNYLRIIKMPVTAPGPGGTPVFNSFVPSSGTYVFGQLSFRVQDTAP